MIKEKLEGYSIEIADSKWFELSKKLDLKIDNICQFCDDKFIIDESGKSAFAPNGERYKTYVKCVLITREDREDDNINNEEFLNSARNYLINEVLDLFREQEKGQNLSWRIKPYFYIQSRPEFLDELLIIRMRMLLY